MSKNITDLNIGDKIKFGKYIMNSTSNDIIWKIADKNNPSYPSDSITLITEKIIDLKAFDALENNVLNTIVDPTSYLIRFSATDSSSIGYYDINKIDLHYWKTGGINSNFWLGRNDILTKFSSSGDIFLNSIKNAISLFDNYLYQLMIDTNNNMTFYNFETDFTIFSQKCVIPISSGGYGLELLTREQLIAIFLTYHLKTVVNIFPVFKGLIDDKSINTLLTYLPKDKLDDIDWIDFNEVVKNNGTLAVTADALNIIKSFMTIEPSAFNPSMSNFSQDRIFIPVFFKKMNIKITGDASYTDYYTSPAIVCDIKYTDSQYHLTQLPNENLSFSHTFIHELGHSIDYSNYNYSGKYFSSMDEWRNIAGWPLYVVNETFKYMIPTKWACDCISTDTEPVITFYGCTSPYEDFAETFACYYLNNNFLKQFFPKRFAFIEKYIKKFSPYVIVNKDYRNIYGNNSYEYSNIRQWLNFSGSNWYKNMHDGDLPPINSNIENNTEYENQNGFLDSFKKFELDLILDTNIIVANNKINYGGGSSSITDKIFLASNTEIGFSNENNIIEGTKLTLFNDNTNKICSLTEQIYDNTLSLQKPTNLSDSWIWVLRTPNTSDEFSVRSVTGYGNITADSACDGSLGLRPLCNIKSDIYVSDYMDADNCYLIQLPDIVESEKITMQYINNLLIANIENLDGNLRKYRILLNGIEKYSNSDYKQFGSKCDINFQLNRTNILLNEKNTITIEIEDNLGNITIQEISFIGEYSGLMFMDENKQFYTTDLGELLQYLDFGTITLGTITEPKKVLIQNKLSFAIKDINLVVESSLQNINIEFCKEENPFIANDTLLLENSYEPNDIDYFYVRLNTTISPNSTNGTFKIIATSTPI